MKIRHLYSFLPIFMLFSVLALCFLSELSPFFNIRQRCLPCCSCNKNQNSHTLFRMKQLSNNNSPFAFNLIQNNKTSFACNKHQIKKHNLFAKKISNNPAPVCSNKKVNLYKPCIYDKQLGFNKPTELLQIVYLPFFGICVLTVACAICATTV